MDGVSYKTFIELLEMQPDQASIPDEEVECVKYSILGVLKRYGIEADKADTIISPSVITIEIIPQQGYKVLKIRKYIDDIERELEEYGLCRMIAPLPGKNALAVEVPRSKRRMVYLHEVLESKEFQESKAELPIALGISTENKPIVADLYKMPHLLIGGATGMGKSVLLNSIIVSLLCRKSPEEVKFMLIDPKMVDLGHYSKIKEQYFVKIEGIDEDIISSPEHVITALNSLCSEMDRRYELLKKFFCRSDLEYNQKLEEKKLSTTHGYKPLSYIIVVIDEFADLIIAHGKAIEIPIARLAQKGRAVGIHLIITTQKTSSDVITGILKANFPVRIAFKVQTFADSRTILDMTGAQFLLDKGDMLISSNENSSRVQGAFIDEPEIERVCDWIAHNNSDYNPYVLSVPSILEVDTPTIDWEHDPLFEEAARLIVESNNASTVMLQRRFSIGYCRAGKIMDQLEQAGIVSPVNGRKPQKMLLNAIFDSRELPSPINRSCRNVTQFSRGQKKETDFENLMKCLEEDSQSISYKDYKIIGNTFDINEILIKNGIINISNEDVLATLNSSGTNYVTTGLSNNGTASEALEDALRNLRDMTSCRIGKMLFNIWVNTENTTLSLVAMKSITDYIERELKDIDVLWGVAIDKSLENKIRVTLLAASK